MVAALESVRECVRVRRTRVRRKSESGRGTATNVRTHARTLAHTHKEAQRNRELSYCTYFEGKV